VDRKPPAAAAHAWARALQADTFVADEFQVGKKDQVWRIDRLRTWIVLEPGANLRQRYQKIALYGGLVDALAADPKPAAECDCHGLTSLKEADLGRGAPGDVRITEIGAVGPNRMVQLDFVNLRWFVPGGTGVQFGVRAAAGVVRPATTDGEDGRLRVFAGSGKFQSLLSPGEAVRIPVQVWAEPVKHP
jgi:hypothetical protein